MARPEILLVGFIHAVKGLLKDGYHVSEYVDQKEVIEGLEFRVKHHLRLPDLIICPANGIESNGYQELIEWTQGLDTKIPLVVMGDMNSKADVNHSIELGAMDFIDENISSGDFLFRIKTLMKLKRQQILVEEVSQYKIPLDKRIFDILVSSILLLMLSPLFLIIILAIRLESKGPVFYWQPRVGSGYRIFKFFKFRSMRVNADKQVDTLKGNNHYQNEAHVQIETSTNSELVGDEGLIEESHFLNEKAKDISNSFFKVKNDPRITKVGKIIRNTSMDELPQLINVFIGDMSIVGNRPLPLYEAEKLTDDRFSERFMAPAGITGLWQVTERGKASTSEDSRKLLDIEYARKHNLLLDLKILIKTPLAALQHENV